MVNTRTAPQEKVGSAEDGQLTLKNLSEKFTNLDVRFTKFETLLTDAIAAKPAQSRSPGGGKTTKTPAQKRSSPYPARVIASPQASTSSGKSTEQVSFSNLLSGAMGANCCTASASAPAVTPPTQLSTLPLNFEQAAGAAIEEQVKVLLTSTAQHFSAIRGKPQYPHDYVVRGQTKQKVSFSALSISEYGWALMAMCKDPKIDQVNKPRISAHLFNVFEDARDYNWSQVREWSEDVFCRLAQKNPPTWDDMFDYESQLLRAAVSKAQGGKMSLPANANNNQQRRQNTSTTRSAKDRHDICCPAYNTSAGCTKQDPHTTGQYTFGHHCEYCRSELDLIHQHPAIYCRIKARRDQPNTQPSKPTTSNTPFRA